MELRHLRYFASVAEQLLFRRAAERLQVARPAVSKRVRHPQRDVEAAAELALLAYELLDAHADTAQLADGLADDRSWAAHLDYLRALQRKGRETLARTASGELSAFRWAGLGSLDVR